MNAIVLDLLSVYYSGKSFGLSVVGSYSVCWCSWENRYGRVVFLVFFSNGDAMTTTDKDNCIAEFDTQLGVRAYRVSDDVSIFIETERVTAGEDEENGDFDGSEIIL